MLLKTLCIFGTRPEAIKLAPIINRLNENPLIQNKVCISSQHVEMLSPVLDLFNICPDFDLKIMRKNQDLSYLTVSILTALNELFQHYRPHLILVHGDTTTTFASSLAAYYHRLPVAHVEAGLRTGDLYSPWPEEANRKLTGALACLHFAPTVKAKNNLLREGIDEEMIHVTGNTVIDALLQTTAQFVSKPGLIEQKKQEFSYLSPERKMILVTGHRRENFGGGINRICQALKRIAELFPNIDIVYPVHLNPNVLTPVQQQLGSTSNIYLIEPIDYLSFVYLMDRSYLILTDSGGIQEEAPSLKKPVLVMRSSTERPEAVAAGAVKLIGTDVDKIVEQVSLLIVDQSLYESMIARNNPYGDGRASERIVDIILNWSTVSLSNIGKERPVSEYATIQ